MTASNFENCNRILNLLVVQWFKRSETQKINREDSLEGKPIVNLRERFVVVFRFPSQFNLQMSRQLVSTLEIDGHENFLNSNVQGRWRQQGGRREENSSNAKAKTRNGINDSFVNKSDLVNQQVRSNKATTLLLLDESCNSTATKNCREKLRSSNKILVVKTVYLREVFPPNTNLAIRHVKYALWRELISLINSPDEYINYKVTSRRIIQRLQNLFNNSSAMKPADLVTNITVIRRI